MALQFRKAQRKAVPMLISISSVSGGGKTYSALLMAAGIAGKKGRVGMIDTESGRGAMYADSPGIRKALPDGYEYIQFDPPHSPARYIEHLKAAEDAGITVCVTDSGTHEWEGIGGCCEIAENNKLGGMPNWAKAKREHKRFVNHLLTSQMHNVFCLRARDKVKMFKRGDAMILSAGQDTDGAPVAEKDTVVQLGLQPVCEKGFIFEALLSLQLDEGTHHARAVKVPEPLAHLFAGKRLITKEDGERIREWNDAGAALGEHEQLQKRARAAAEDGTAAYVAFFGELTAAQKKTLVATTHEENKRVAAQADADIAAEQSGATNGGVEVATTLPDPAEHAIGTRRAYQGAVWVVADNEDGPRWQKEAA